MNPLKGWLCIDIETDGSPWGGKLLRVGVSDPLEPDVFTTTFYEPTEWLRSVLADPEVGTVEHTLYDARWLRLAGIEVNGPIADTRVMAWNVNENTKLDLESLVFRYLMHKMDKRLRSGKHGVMFRCDDGAWVPISEAPDDQMDRYSLGDVRETAYLFNHLLPLQPKYWDKQLELTSVLLDMECTGVPIDEAALELTRAVYTAERDSLKEQLLADLPAAFNINSGDQVAALLFLNEFELPGRVPKGEEPEGFEITKSGRLWTTGTWRVRGFGLQPGKWTKSEKRPATDSKTLAVKYGAHPWVSQYLDYQKVDKLVGTYLETLPRYIHGGRLYGTFNQAGTVSGRLSSANPNLQNQPRRGRYGASVRRLFAGALVVADFSQLEPRLMAHFSQDPELLRVFNEDEDVYLSVGAGAFGKTYDAVTPDEREISKALVLSMGYGAQARKLAEILSVGGHPTTQKQAATYLGGVQDRFPRFFEWREEIVDQSKAAGYVTTLGGRKRHIGYDSLDSAWKAERQAVNSKIQGSAADIVNGTMLEVAHLPDVRILIQVHDELVCEYLCDVDDVPLEEIQYAGEHGHGLEISVPLVFEPKVCETWEDK